MTVHSIIPVASRDTIYDEKVIIKPGGGFCCFAGAVTIKFRHSGKDIVVSPEEPLINKTKHDMEL